MESNQEELSKIAQGKATLKSFFSTGSKDEIKDKLAETNKNLKLQVEQIDQLYKLICGNIVYVELENMIVLFYNKLYRKAKIIITFRS